MSNGVEINSPGDTVRIFEAITIEILDVDYLKITGPYGKGFKITGGDFESIISAMQSIADDN